MSVISFPFSTSRSFLLYRCYVATFPSHRFLDVTVLSLTLITLRPLLRNAIPNRTNYRVYRAVDVQVRREACTSNACPNGGLINPFRRVPLVTNEPRVNFTVHRRSLIPRTLFAIIFDPRPDKKIPGENFRYGTLNRCYYLRRLSFRSRTFTFSSRKRSSIEAYSLVRQGVPKLNHRRCVSAIRIEFYTDARLSRNENSRFVGKECRLQG